MKINRDCYGKRGKLRNFSCNNKIRGVELLVYQEKKRRTCVINRPIQHLVPLEVANINITALDEEHNEPAGEMRPRRQVAKNADIFRKLQEV